VVIPRVWGDPGRCSRVPRAWPRWVPHLAQPTSPGGAANVGGYPGPLPTRHVGRQGVQVRRSAGAERWLIEAAAVGAQRVRSKMATCLCRLYVDLGGGVRRPCRTRPAPLLLRHRRGTRRQLSFAEQEQHGTGQVNIGRPTPAWRRPHQSGKVAIVPLDKLRDTEVGATNQDVVRTFCTRSRRPAGAGREAAQVALRENRRRPGPPPTRRRYGSRVTSTAWPFAPSTTWRPPSG
jgi:hypothetical protein